MVGEVAITPLPLGLFTVPGRSVAEYDEVAVRAPYVVCAYLVRHPQGTVLFDTGIVGDEEAVATYAPRAFALDAQLDAVALTVADIDVVINCHLHADHAGGNFQFTRTPIVVQQRELDAADQPDYTVRAACVDFPGAQFQVIEGRYEVLPGVTVTPTPGHSPGHQSLLVRGSQHGTILLAGQAFNSASDFALAALAHQLGGDGLDVATTDWMRDLCRTEIDVALFAHDLAQWRPSHGSFAGASLIDAWPA